MSKHLPSQLRWACYRGERDAAPAHVSQEDEHAAKIRSLVPPWMKVADPSDAANYDPYNSGASRVRAVQSARKNLDSLRKLDQAIRRSQKRYW